MKEISLPFNLVLALSWILSLVAGYSMVDSAPGRSVGIHRSKRLRRSLHTRTRELTLPSPTTTAANNVESVREAQQCRYNEAPLKPTFSIGMIADIQYAPIPDGYSYAGVPRFYRHSLDAARYAAQHFQRELVSLVVNLGDIVDGKCQAIAQNGGDSIPENIDPGHEVVDRVLSALSEYKAGPIVHIYGNHCLYNLDRRELSRKLGIPFVKEPSGDWVGYCSRTLHGIRFITIDTYDITLLGRCPTSSMKHCVAAEILAVNNPNFPKQANSPEGLNGSAKRFVAFNGGVGSVQLSWLRTELDSVRKSGEKALILSHQPIHPGSSSPTCLVWNYEEVLAILREYSDIVLASFAGHAHKGGYMLDSVSGIHFRVLEAVLESPNPYKTYAILDFYDDHHIEVKGFGECKSAVYEFKRGSFSSHESIREEQKNVIDWES